MAATIAIAAAAAIASAVGNIISQRKQRKELKKAQREADVQAAENRAWYDKEYNTPFTETTEAKSALELARERLAEDSRRAAQASAITGGSNESAVARKEAGNKRYDSLLKTIASQGTAQKNFVENTFRSGQASNNALRSGLTNYRMNLSGQQAAYWNNLMDNAFNIAEKSSYGKQSTAGKGSTE